MTLDENSPSFKALTDLAEMQNLLLKAKLELQSTLSEESENSEQMVYVINAIEQLLKELRSIPPDVLPSQEQRAKITTLLILIGAVLSSDEE